MNPPIRAGVPRRPPQQQFLQPPPRAAQPPPLRGLAPPPGPPVQHAPRNKHEPQEQQPQQSMPPPSQQPDYYHPQDYEDYDESISPAQPPWPQKYAPSSQTRPPSSQLPSQPPHQQQHQYHPPPSGTSRVTDSYLSAVSTSSSGVLVPPSAASTAPRASTTASERVINTVNQLEKRVLEVQEEICKLRDVTHDVRTNMQAVPTREEVKEELRDIVSPGLYDGLLDSISTLFNETVAPLSQRTAQLTADKITALSPPSSGAEPPNNNDTTAIRLVEQLVSSLRPVEQLRKVIEDLDTLPEALQSVNIFNRNMELLHQKVDQMKMWQQTPPLPPTPTPTIDVADAMERMEERMAARFEALQNKVTGFASRDDISDMVNRISRDIEALRPSATPPTRRHTRSPPSPHAYTSSPDYSATNSFPHSNYYAIPGHFISQGPFPSSGLVSRASTSGSETALRSETTNVANASRGPQLITPPSELDHRYHPYARPAWPAPGAMPYQEGPYMMPHQVPPRDRAYYPPSFQQYPTSPTPNIYPGPAQYHPSFMRSWGEQQPKPQTTAVPRAEPPSEMLRDLHYTTESPVVQPDIPLPCTPPPPAAQDILPLPAPAPVRRLVRRAPGNRAKAAAAPIPSPVFTPAPAPAPPLAPTPEPALDTFPAAPAEEDVFGPVEAVPPPKPTRKRKAPVISDPSLPTQPAKAPRKRKAPVAADASPPTPPIETLTPPAKAPAARAKKPAAPRPKAPPKPRKRAPKATAKTATPPPPAAETAAVAVEETPLPLVDETPPPPGAEDAEAAAPPPSPSRRRDSPGLRDFISLLSPSHYFSNITLPGKTRSETRRSLSLASTPEPTAAAGPSGGDALP